jgi:hypothetical protein
MTSSGLQKVGTYIGWMELLTFLRVDNRRAEGFKIVKVVQRIWLLAVSSLGKPFYIVPISKKNTLMFLYIRGIIV